VKLLLKNLHQFNGVYLGKLYCLEVIGFLLREVLEVKFGMKIQDIEQMSQEEHDGFKDLIHRRKQRLRKREF
jgi:hypothetical protein